MNIAKQVTRQRERIIKELLPDRCTITPKLGANPQVVGVGRLTSDAPEPRIWRGSTDVPCRIDLSRAFRPEKLKAQATEVDEFTLELPFDMVVYPTDIVRVVNPNTGRVERFEIRKKKDLSAFDATIECTIATLGLVIDG